MGNKNGFNVAQRTGIQYFVHERENMRVVYYGAGMDHVVSGEIVFFEREDGLFWFGRTYHNMYVLTLQEPIEQILTGMTFISHEKRMLEVNEENEFVFQGELPF